MAYEQPQVRAGGDIGTYRLVIASTDDFTVTAAGANALNTIGFSAGDNKEFDTALHAESGDQVRIQPGPMVQVTSAGTITAGAEVEPAADGKVSPLGLTGPSVGVALTSGAADDIIWVYADRGYKP